MKESLLRYLISDPGTEQITRPHAKSREATDAIEWCKLWKIVVRERGLWYIKGGKVFNFKSEGFRFNTCFRCFLSQTSFDKMSQIPGATVRRTFSANSKYLCLLKILFFFKECDSEPRSTFSIEIVMIITSWIQWSQSPAHVDWYWSWTVNVMIFTMISLASTIKETHILQR
jgi:hypothetical protein